MIRLLLNAAIFLFLAASVGAWAQGLPGSTIDSDSSSAASAPAADTPAGDAPAAETPTVSGGSDSGDVEQLYEKEDSKPQAKPAEDSQKDKVKADIENKMKSVKVQNLSDLAKLAPFADVAVIERRFLPKTNRFEFSASAFTNLNNPFYQLFGVDFQAAYYFTEKWALEAIADLNTSSSRQVTDDLKNNRNISTSNLVTTRSFYGAAIKWNPIYGKITWLNRSIVPFDLNFNAGGGMTQTADGQSVATVHLGTSQVFAYSKSMAFRWDFSWNMYQANATDDSNKKVNITQNDVYLGLGVSFYFPEATYR